MVDPTTPRKFHCQEASGITSPGHLREAIAKMECRCADVGRLCAEGSRVQYKLATKRFCCGSIGSGVADLVWCRRTGTPQPTPLSYRVSWRTRRASPRSGCDRRQGEAQTHGVRPSSALVVS